MGLEMGLLSFLFGGKKKEAVKPPASAKLTSIEKQLAAAAKPVAKAVIAEPVIVGPMTAGGAAQAKLRLKLAASLRQGEHAAAYEAARRLADIQVKAGRKTAARVWIDQAERIKDRRSA